MCERVPACQGVGWRWRELEGELTLSIQQGLVGTFWISFNGLFTRLSRVIARIYEINNFFSHDPAWHGHPRRYFSILQGEKNMNEIQYCFKCSVVVTCGPAFGSIKRTRSSHICHQWTLTVSDLLFLSSFIHHHTPLTLLLPVDSIPL